LEPFFLRRVHPGPGPHSDGVDLVTTKETWNETVAHRSLRALPTETNVESGTFQSKSGTSFDLSNSGTLEHVLLAW